MVFKKIVFKKMLFKKSRLFILSVIFIVLFFNITGFGREANWAGALENGVWEEMILNWLPENDSIMDFKIGNVGGFLFHVSNPAVYDLTGVSFYSISFQTNQVLTIASLTARAYELGKANLVTTDITTRTLNFSNGQRLEIVKLPKQTYILELYSETGLLGLVMKGKFYKDPTNYELERLLESLYRLVNSR